MSSVTPVPSIALGMLLVIVLAVVGLIVLVATLIGKKAGVGTGIAAAILVPLGLLLLGALLLMPIRQARETVRVRNMSEAAREEAMTELEYQRRKLEQARAEHRAHLEGQHGSVETSPIITGSDSVEHSNQGNDVHSSTSSTSEVSGYDSHGDSVPLQQSDAHSGSHTDTVPVDVPIADVYQFEAGDPSKAWNLVEGGNDFVPTYVYSTIEAATRGLATRAAIEVLSRWPEKHEDSLQKAFVVFNESEGRIDSTVFEEQLRTELPVDVQVTSEPVDLPESSMLLRVRYLERKSAKTDSYGFTTTTGRIEVKAKNLDGPGEIPLASTRFEQKVWLTSSSLSQGYQVARSGGFPASRELAIQRARADAINQLAARADGQFGHHVVYRFDNLKQQLHNQLVQGQFVYDQFLQEVEMIGKDKKFWRCALLIRPDESNLEKAVQTVGAYRAQIREQRVTRSISTLGFFIVLIGLYAVVNAATKGYYSWALRGVTFVLAATAVVWVVVTWS